MTEHYHTRLMIEACNELPRIWACDQGDLFSFLPHYLRSVRALCPPDLLTAIIQDALYHCNPTGYPKPIKV